MEGLNRVTTAQRARLVVAMGVLNLVIGSMAIALALGMPRQPRVAEQSPPPAPVAVVPSRTPAAPTPGPTAGSPEPSSTAPAEPSPPPPGPPSTVPSSNPGTIALGPVSVTRPTPQTQPTSPPPTGPPSNPPTTQPTAPPPTAQPTVQPPKPTPPVPKPTPSPKPVAHKNMRPPCPGTVDVPPGKGKVAQADRPCKPSSPPGQDHKSGVIIGFAVLPLWSVAAAVLAGTRRVRRRTVEAAGRPLHADRFER
jgi:hypothetical protein